MSCQQQKEAEKLDVSAFFQHLDKSEFRISPDGRYLSFLQHLPQKRNLQIRSLRDNKAFDLKNNDLLDVCDYLWGTDGSIVYCAERLDNGKMEVVWENMRGERKVMLSRGPGETITFLSSRVFPDNQVLLALKGEREADNKLYKLDLYTGSLETQEITPERFHYWSARAKGQINPLLSKLGTKLLRGKKEHAGRGGMNPDQSMLKDQIELIAPAEGKESSFYALSNVTRDRTALVKVDGATGKELAMIYEADSTDVTGAYYSPSNGRLLYAEYKTPRLKRHYFDPDAARMFELVEANLGKVDCKVLDEDAKGERMLLHAYSDTHPGALYLYDRSTGSLTKAFSLNEQLSADKLVEMRTMSYLSRDSMRIQGFITMPENVKGKVPLVVIPHEGPAARDDWRYHPQVQFLCNRGYAVLQLNFRGSIGFGKSFWVAGFKEWGRNIQHDIETGVRRVIKEGLIDPSRIAILGTEFGGYCALYGLCFNSDLYKCGISRSGFVNLFTFVKSALPQPGAVRDKFYEMVGDPAHEIEYFRSVSPVFHSHRIKAPLLLVHEAKPTDLNVSETSRFVRDLRSRKVNVTYLVRNPDASRSFHVEEIQFHEELERFLMTHLK